MRSLKISVAIILPIILISILGLFAVGTILSRNGTRIDSQSENDRGRVEYVDDQTDAKTLLSSPIVPIATQRNPPLDGPVLLEEHCAKCHVVQRLEQIEQSRAAWEKILMQMEGMGVHLSDTEKFVLLDYLTGTTNP
jgi:hypothetical protein